MKHSLLAIILLALPITVWSQNEVQVASICDQLRTSGKVIIQQDSRLDALLTRESKVYNAASHLKTTASGKKILTAQGYRVRVYSGNNQIKSREEALTIKQELNDYDPSLTTYLLFRSPNWRLLVGNFRTAEEATALLRVLKKRFPVYGQEMFVVKDLIQIPLDPNEPLDPENDDELAR